MEIALKVKQNRQEIAKRMEEVMRSYRFDTPRSPGRPKNTRNAGRPRAIDASTVVLLEEAFKYGCSIIEACATAGISRDAYYEWIKINPNFSDRVKELQANPTVRARISVYEGMKYNGELALKYLERKLPEEFSLKAVVQHNVEFTGIALDRPKPIEALPIVTQEVEKQ